MGRILAARSIAPMKKDVTGYLYGGDITRKMKLWQKQKKAKKNEETRQGPSRHPARCFYKNDAGVVEGLTARRSKIFRALPFREAQRAPTRLKILLRLAVSQFN